MAGEVVENKKALPLPVLGVKFQVARALHFAKDPNAGVSDFYYRSDVFSVMMFQKITRSLPFLATKRG